jgi:hypothetical protein
LLPDLLSTGSRSTSVFVGGEEWISWVVGALQLDKWLKEPESQEDRRPRIPERWQGIMDERSIINPMKERTLG